MPSPPLSKFAPGIEPGIGIGDPLYGVVAPAHARGPPQISNTIATTHEYRIRFIGPPANNVGIYWRQAQSAVSSDGCKREAIRADLNCVRKIWRKTGNVPPWHTRQHVTVQFLPDR